MKKLLILVASIIPLLSIQAQRPFTPQELEKWERITSRTISDDGKWVSATFSPWRGDTRIELHSADGSETIKYSPATVGTFSPSSEYFIVKEVAPLRLTDSLKLAKAKSMPQDKLLIRNLSAGTTVSIDSVIGYRLAETGDYVAYQRCHKDSALIVSALDGKESKRVPSPSSYAFAQKSATLYYVTKDTTKNKPGLYILDAVKGEKRLIKEGKGTFSSIRFNNEGDKIAFLYTEKKDKEHTQSMWLSIGGAPAHEAVNRSTAGVPEGWVISPNYSLSFSKDGSRIFLGTAPEPLRKDSTILESNRPNVQVWSWDEPVQYTVQQYNLNSDLKKSYTALYDIAGKRFAQIADTALPNCQLPREGTGEWAILSTSAPYSLSSMWEGRTRYDHYKISLTTGERTPIVAGDYTYYLLSPGNRYAAGYNPADSCWYTVNLQSEKNQLTRLTTPRTFVAWDEDNDTPDYPSPHGSAGWTKEDGAILIYDRYDIWSFNPDGKGEPVNLTKNGRAEGITYRYQPTKHNEQFIDTKERAFLSAFNHTDKSTNLCSTTFAKPAIPKRLTDGNYRHGNLKRAKNSDTYIFTRENYGIFPDVWVTDKKFKKPTRLTEGFKQQEQYIWGKVELVSWTAYDGTPLEGLLYRPDNFDPAKKYPMIVNFYERNSHNLHNFRHPEPNRSTIDYCMYLSNGYIIFNPDVRYKDGYPGKNCYDCVVSGVEKVVSLGNIDTARIGAQGHSWGGYQVAYLATRTNMFAAIESGAPVVNMFSAYGGIRWGSGKARSFQYEHTQSRLGGTPWSHPERYKESSPLFEMDKVQTPILIMHNDKDGHVPWYQGIEYFVALKRLGKPAWMLNYPDEPHWPMKFPNRVDFQIRMKQFFDHYLQGAPMPKWMKEGVPAVMQPFELGY